MFLPHWIHGGVKNPRRKMMFHGKFLENPFSWALFPSTSFLVYKRKHQNAVNNALIRDIVGLHILRNNFQEAEAALKVLFPCFDEFEQAFAV